TRCLRRPRSPDRRRTQPAAAALPRARSPASSIGPPPCEPALVVPSSTSGTDLLPLRTGELRARPMEIYLSIVPSATGGTDLFVASRAPFRASSKSGACAFVRLRLHSPRSKDGLHGWCNSG